MSDNEMKFIDCPGHENNPKTEMPEEIWAWDSTPDKKTAKGRMWATYNPSALKRYKARYIRADLVKEMRND